MDVCPVGAVSRCLPDYLPAASLARDSKVQTVRGIDINTQIFCSLVFNTALRGVLSILFFAPDMQRAGIVFHRLFIQPNVESFIQLHVVFGFFILVVFWAWHYIHYRWHTGEIVERCHPLVRAVLYTAGFYVILFGGVETTAPFIYYQF